MGMTESSLDGDAGHVDALAIATKASQSPAVDGGGLTGDCRAS